MRIEAQKIPATQSEKISLIIVSYLPKGRLAPHTIPLEVGHRTAIMSSHPFNASTDSGDLSKNLHCCVGVVFSGFGLPLPSFEDAEMRKLFAKFKSRASRDEKEDALFAADDQETVMKAVIDYLTNSSERQMRCYQLHIFPQECSILEFGKNAHKDLDGVYDSLDKIAADPNYDVSICVTFDIKVSYVDAAEARAKMGIDTDTTSIATQATSGSSIDPSSPLAAASRAQRTQAAASSELAPAPTDNPSKTV